MIMIIFEWNVHDHCHWMFIIYTSWLIQIVYTCACHILAVAFQKGEHKILSTLPSTTKRASPTKWRATTSHLPATSMLTSTRRRHGRATSSASPTTRGRRCLQATATPSLMIRQAHAQRTDGATAAYQLRYAACAAEGVRSLRLRRYRLWRRRHHPRRQLLPLRAWTAHVSTATATF